MPVKKNGDKYSVNNKDYDTEDAANKAYMAYLDEAMGVSTDKQTKTKTAKKKVAKEDSEENEENS